MIEVIAAPFDGSGARLGSRLGPAALELAGLVETLAEQGVPVADWHETVGNQRKLDSGPEPTGLKSFDQLVANVAAIRRIALEALERKRIPLTLGGEHSIAMGGVSAALEYTGGDLALLWIDAHADLNTPALSPSGNLHGMPVAALAGLESPTGDLFEAQWEKLTESIARPEPLSLSRCAWIGLRDVDTGEAKTLEAHPDCLAITMQHIDREGLQSCVMAWDAWMRRHGAKNLYISFDVDALDPALAPGTGTAVRGGLTYREGHLLAELLAEALGAKDCPYRLIGIDLVEVNPIEDVNNTTAKMAVEWIASLFGRTILNRGSRR